MNEQAREALVSASLQGVRQIRGIFWNGKGGYCALGVLAKSLGLEGSRIEPWYKTEHGAELSQERLQCPACNFMGVESLVISHMNDDHEFDFLTIARKL